MKRGVTPLILSAILVLTFCLAPDALAKRKKVSADPDAPSNEEAKVLGWGPVQTPNRAKNPEYMIRGVILSVEKVKDSKGYFTVNILPIEVLDNHQRAITFDHFNTGIPITMAIPEPRLKELKKGRMVEYKQYYTESVEQAVGGAKMVAMQFHQEIQGYPAGPGAYLKTPGFYPVQYKNALKGVKLYLGNLKSDTDFKNHVDFLATKSQDPELKTIANTTYMELYATPPSGRCSVNNATKTVACN
ncbi:MAG: hypothetical protein R3257_00920 [bacterium]|nr:hypothetical protein [bacterium]